MSSKCFSTLLFCQRNFRNFLFCNTACIRNITTTTTTIIISNLDVDYRETSSNSDHVLKHQLDMNRNRARTEKLGASEQGDGTVNGIALIRVYSTHFSRKFENGQLGASILLFALVFTPCSDDWRYEDGRIFTHQSPFNMFYVDFYFKAIPANLTCQTVNLTFDNMLA